MRIWTCDLFTDSALSNLGVTFLARADTLGEAAVFLEQEMQSMQVHLYPGPLQEDFSGEVYLPPGRATLAIRAQPELPRIP